MSRARIGGPLDALEARDTPSVFTGPTTPRMFAVGADTGGGPRVQVYTASDQRVADFFAFEPGYTGGVRVATADYTGDGQDDLAVGAGAAGGPRVRVYDGRTGDVTRDFFAFEPAQRNGVFLGTGDVTGDGAFDLLVGAGPGGGPRVNVYDGRSFDLIRSAFGADPNLRGGAYVAGGDLTGDGKAEVVVATGRFNPAFVTTFDGATGRSLGTFEGYDEVEREDLPGVFRTAADLLYPGRGDDELVEGIYAANVADVDGDGRGEIVTGRVLGRPEVRIFEGPNGDRQDGNDEDDDDTTGNRFEPFPVNLISGVRPAAKDLNGDGRAELMVGSGSGGSDVRVLDGATRAELYRFTAFPGFVGGVTVG